VEAAVDWPWSLTALGGVLGGYSVLIGALALCIQARRARPFAVGGLATVGLVAPAALAIQCATETGRISQWLVLLPLWAGMPLCLWTLVLLFQDEVREDFLAGAQKAERDQASWKPLEMAALITTSLAFVLAGLGGLFLLAHHYSPLNKPALAAILLAAPCSIALMLIQQFRRGTQPRVVRPGLFLVVLTACASTLPWTFVFGETPGTDFWHGASFGGLNVLVALALLISLGNPIRAWQGAAMLTVGLTGFVLVLWWNAIPVGIIGSTWLTDITSKPLYYGAWTSAALAVLTAIAGALHLRAALAAGRA
jgi:hypothetical protein